MKDYNEIANSVFQRREEYLKEKKRKKALIIRNATIALSCCIMIAVGIGIWNIGMLRDIEPSPDKNDYTLPVPVVTTDVITSEEDITSENTAATATTDDILATTAIVSDNSAQSGASDTRTTSANSHSGSGNVTTLRFDGTTESNVRTTASSIEITSPNNSSHQNVTTSNGGSPVLTTRSTDVRTTPTTSRTSTRTTGTRTTTRRTSTTTRRTSTTTRRTSTTARTTRTTMPPVATTTTTRAQTTYVYTSTTAAYTRPAYTTTAVYTTQYIYTSMTSVMTSMVHTQPAYTYPPVATSTTPAYTHSPVATSTTASHSSAQPAYTSTPPIPVLSTTYTDPPHSKFYYNSTTYTVAECENFDTSYAGEELYRSGIYDVALGRLTMYTVYAYKDFSPDFLCMVEFDDGETFLGINPDYSPNTLGELLDAIDFPNGFDYFGLDLYDVGRYISSPDYTALSELLNSSRNAKILQILDYPLFSRRLELDFGLNYTGDENTCIIGKMLITDQRSFAVSLFNDLYLHTFEFDVDSTTLDKLYASLNHNV